MDLWRGNVSSVTPEQVLSPTCSKLGGTLDDLFSSHTTEAGDVSLEWLSAFVEDCLSSTGNCMPQTAPNTTNLQKTCTNNIIAPKPLEHQLEGVEKKHNTNSWSQKFVIPSKARSKRKRSPKPTKTQFSFWSHHHHHHQNSQKEDCDDHHDLHMMMISSSSTDPPLLQQAYWLADSELILPKKQEDSSGSGVDQPKRFTGSSNGQGQQARRCSHCLAQRTPQWRAGPLGPKTLCNACGVRYKSGRLLPEYRPAKSPTFLSYKHSNSHKKVLEMRTSTTTTMSLLSSSSTTTTTTSTQH